MLPVDNKLQELALDKVKLTNEQIELQTLEELQSSLMYVNDGLNGLVFIPIWDNYEEHMIELDKHRLLEIKKLILRRIKDREYSDMSENISSSGQNGGITAHTVYVGTNSASSQPDKTKPWWKKIAVQVGIVVTFLAAVVPILEYVDVKPWQKNEAKEEIIKGEKESKRQESKKIKIKTEEKKMGPEKKHPKATASGNGNTTSVGSVTVQPGAVASFGQSGGQTAQTIINQAEPPRRLSQQQIVHLQDAARLSCQVIGNISVTAANSDHEAQVYALDFVNAFRGAGCSADLELPTPGLTPDVTGVRIGVRDIENIPMEAQKLREAMATLGIQFFINPMKPDFFPNNKFVLIIGSKG